MKVRRNFGLDPVNTYEIEGDTLVIRSAWIREDSRDVPLAGATIELQRGLLGRLIDFGNVTVTVASGDKHVCTNIHRVSRFREVLRSRADGSSRRNSAPDGQEQSAIPDGTEFSSHLLLFPWLGGTSENAVVAYNGIQRNRWVNAGDRIGWIRRMPGNWRESLLYWLFPGSLPKYELKTPVAGIVAEIPSGASFVWTKPGRSGRTILLPVRDAHFDRDSWRQEAWKHKRKIQRRDEWWELGENELSHEFDVEELTPQELDAITSTAKPRWASE